MSDAVDLKTLEERIRREIPTAGYMQISIASANADRVELLAPLKPNKNHEGTAFGGSVSSLALLSCWTLVNINLESLAPSVLDYVVVQNSEINFMTPIDSDFSATAEAVTDSAFIDFLRTLERRGRARIGLRAKVSSLGGVCAELNARFVAQVK